MTTPAPSETKSQQLFRSADKTVQSVVKEVLSRERTVMHMKRRDDIHKDLVQIINRATKA